MIIFNIVAAGVIIFNLTKVNFSALLEGDSVVALITILAALCAVILLHILRLSRRINKHQNSKK